MKEKDKNPGTEDVLPDPEHLIKSISEQGYSLESSLADLIDNSISANSKRIEILVDTDSEPFILFIADDGDGMDEKALKLNLKFPSSSPDEKRHQKDLGRFGLGLKTASFAQTRCFTVLSKKKGGHKYCARTWDVGHLKDTKKWEIIVNTQEQIDALLDSYKALSNNFLNGFDNYNPSTIIAWQGLYKFDAYLDSELRSQSVKKEITEITSEYLSLVFHRFLEKSLKIRINNNILNPFNPFPEQSDLRKIESNQKLFKSSKLLIEGYILPSRSIKESKNNSIWTLPNKGLMEMEGIYIYREDRLILFGGWQGIIKKSPKLQLARIKVNLGNSVDHLFHLNVAKSSIVIPYDLKVSFLRYISIVKNEAEKEYNNTSLRSVTSREKQAKDLLFIRKPSNTGMLMEINMDFPLVKSIIVDLDVEKQKIFNVLVRIINTTINKIRQVHEDSSVNDVTVINSIDEDQIISALQELRKNGLTNDQLKKKFIPALGIKFESLSERILNELNF